MWYENPFWKDIERINNIYRDVYESPMAKMLDDFNRSQAAIDRISSMLTTPAWLSALEQTEKFSQIASFADSFKDIGLMNTGAMTIDNSILRAVDEYKSLLPKMDFVEKMLGPASALKEYASLIDKITTSPVMDAMKSLTKFNFSFAQAKNVEIGDVRFQDHCIIIDDEIYTVEAMQGNIVDVANELATENDTKKIGKTLKKKLSVVLAFLQVVTLIYGTLNMCVDLNDKLIVPVIQSINGTDNIEYVKVEKAFIKQEPNAKSKNICEIYYAESVEIIEEIKYWRKIKYCSDDKEIIGWISKISIGSVEE